jgi:hypothetical protein
MSANISETTEKRNRSGCAATFLIALPVLDAFAVILSGAGPYKPLVLALGLVGFTAGAAVGAWVSVKIMHERWWSSCRWAIFGLVGVLVPIVLAAAAAHWRQ